MSIGFTRRLADYFEANRGRWIDGRELATIAGAYAWRTRLSECRRAPYLLTVENRIRFVGKVKISEYRVPRAQGSPENPVSGRAGEGIGSTTSCDLFSE